MLKVPSPLPPNPTLTAASSASAVRGDDLPGDCGHVPRHHQRDDVSHRQPRPAHRGKKNKTKKHRERHASAMHAQQLVHVTSGRDHRQRLQQHREPGTHPADGPGLHRAGRAAHKVG